MFKKIIFLALAIALLATAACDKVNNKEVPAYTVRLNLSTYALWNTYGVAGVGDYRFFSRPKQLPANFPYNANTYTGYGGVLLIMGLNSASGSYEPIAFDAACPVENSMDVVVGIDATNFDAVCPKCGSHYDVLMGAGGPKSGVAHSSKYGLRNLVVRASQSGGYIITSY
ncbi:MAG: hypothetical protein IJ808_05575 [Muribaculaceae bacterium]|nr:hypothetical protein [Muribaculaceae bacterium]